MTVDRTHAAELVIRAMLFRDPRPASIAQALADAGLLRSPLATVYRALYDTDSLGLHTTAGAAAHVCEEAAAQDWPDARLTWSPVVEDEPEGLMAMYAGDTPTEYYTEPLLVHDSTGGAR
ncbi:hypothetical protein ACFYS8_13260 [Kitasatospora sp. NPDC004615]|uniref:hypothetical protein n=1 Tax=unclassified Kitasatospora TaxID=2633591 RepID=UPI0036B37EEB